MAEGNNREVDRPYKFDEQARAVYLAHLAEFGLHYQAAQAAGVTGQTVYDHRQKDEAFAALVEEAKGFYKDFIEHEVRRRAIEGCVEFYVQGGAVVMVPDADANGDVYPLRDAETGEILHDAEGRPMLKMKPLVKRVYSDKLIEMLAKRHIPEFREKQQVDLNVTTGVLRVEKQVSKEDWEARLQKLRDTQAGFGSVIDGTFEEVNGA
jgi:hypothetical protein